MIFIFYTFKEMIIFHAILAFIISCSIAILHKEIRDDKKRIQNDSKMMVFGKSFILSFLVLYIGYTFFFPQEAFDALKPHDIEIGDPDF